jgi:hypothetical protein
MSFHSGEAKDNSMFNSFSPELLQAGAIGIGLAILGYTGALLKQELSRPHPRAESRTLIVIYMAFSLIAFAGAGYIELTEKKGGDELAAAKSALNSEQANSASLMKERDNFKTQLDGIIGQIGRIDESVGLKYAVEVQHLPDTPQRANLILFTNSVCRTVTDMMRQLVPPKIATCQIIRQ